MKKQNNIFIRKKIKEQDFLTALDNISKKLIYKFRFGYHETIDMKQQAAIFAMEGLEQYDNSRPLENFLWTHVRNRLFNFKRDNYFRPDNVCVGCPFHDPKYLQSDNQCSKFTNKLECNIYLESANRNITKKNIMKPIHMDHETNLDEDHNSGFVDHLADKEIVEIIEKNLEIKYREDYLKLKAGIKIHKNKFVLLQKHILQILDTHRKNHNE